MSYGGEWRTFMTNPGSPFDKLRTNGDGWRWQVAAIVVCFSLPLAACGGSTQTGNPRLPDGLDSLRVAPVDANAYVYVRPQDPVTVLEDAFPGSPATDRGGATAHAVESLEAVARDLGADQAVRLTFELEGSAERVFGRVMGASDRAPGDWASVDGRSVAIGRAGGPWGVSVRLAWQTDTRVPLAEQYADFWELLQQMPDNPPARPVAAGFVLDVSDLIDRLLAAKGIAMPGLTDGLGLMRIGPVAFVGYSDGLRSLPGGSAGAILADLDAAAIFLTESGYPGFLIGPAFDQLSRGSGLVEVDVAEDTANYREVNPDFHLMVKTFGSTFFFSVGPTRERAQALMASVIRSREEQVIQE